MFPVCGNEWSPWRFCLLGPGQDQAQEAGAGLRQDRAASLDRTEQVLTWPCTLAMSKHHLNDYRN